MKYNEKQIELIEMIWDNICISYEIADERFNIPDTFDEDYAELDDEEMLKRYYDEFVYSSRKAEYGRRVVEDKHEKLYDENKYQKICEIDMLRHPDLYEQAQKLFILLLLDREVADRIIGFEIDYTCDETADILDFILDRSYEERGHMLEEIEAGSFELDRYLAS